MVPDSQIVLFRLIRIVWSLLSQRGSVFPHSEQPDVSSAFYLLIQSQLTSVESLWCFV